MTVNDHRGRGDKPGAECKDIDWVDEECVNSMLVLGQYAGRCGLTNNCQVFVRMVLQECQNMSFEPPPAPDPFPLPPGGGVVEEGYLVGASVKKVVVVSLLVLCGAFLAFWAVMVGVLLVPICNGIPLMERSFRCLQPIVYGGAGVACLVGAGIVAKRGGRKSQ
jgi:hypothetical protein